LPDRIIGRDYRLLELAYQGMPRCVTMAEDLRAAALTAPPPPDTEAANAGPVPEES
jgi:hypothetical protein